MWYKLSRVHLGSSRKEDLEMEEEEKTSMGRILRHLEEILSCSWEEELGCFTIPEERRAALAAEMAEKIRAEGRLPDDEIVLASIYSKLEDPYGIDEQALSEIWYAIRAS